MYELLFKGEIIRKLFHVFTCIFPLLLYYYGTEICSPYFFLCGLLFISFDIARQSNHKIRLIFDYFFSKMTRDYEEKGLTGASYACFSIILITFLFDAKIAIVSLLIMSLSDPIASLFGYYFGCFKIYNKSLEGSIAFFFVSSIVLISFDFSYLEVIVASLFCAIIELLSNKIKIDDNLLIPATGSGVLFFLQYI